MDVKLNSGQGIAFQKSGGATGLQRPVTTLSSGAVKTVASGQPAVEVAPLTKGARTADLRSRVNDVIALTNLARDATNEIGKLIESIGGITEQASDPATPETNLPVLEREAQELLDEVLRRAKETSLNGVHPLAGDEIRLEVEQTIGRTLSLILPDDAAKGFGLPGINFTTRDSIISTITNVNEAQKRIEDLRQAVSKGLDQVKSTVDEVEVALHNGEAASSANVKNVEEAAKLADETRVLIAKNPDGALGSFTKLSAQSASLLE